MWYVKRTIVCTFLLTILGVDHPQGEGKMVHKECPVEVYWIVPYNLAETPYALLLCIGVHNHPLNPPNKLVPEIATELLELITRMRDPLLTNGMYKQPYVGLYRHSC